MIDEMSCSLKSNVILRRLPWRQRCGESFVLFESFVDLLACYPFTPFPYSFNVSFVKIQTCWVLMESGRRVYLWRRPSVSFQYSGFSAFSRQLFYVTARALLSVPFSRATGFYWFRQNIVPATPTRWKCSVTNLPRKKVGYSSILTVSTKVKINMFVWLVKIMKIRSVYTILPVVKMYIRVFLPLWWNSLEALVCQGNNMFYHIFVGEVKKIYINFYYVCEYPRYLYLP